MIYEFDMTDLEFRLIQEFFCDNFGIHFKGDKRSFMKMKLYPRIINLGMSSFKEYLNYAKYRDTSKREISQLLSLLINNETYFFREYSQLSVLKSHLLPELRERKINNNERKIKILSAGCSTGEETYSIAMLTFDTGNFLWGWDVKIIGMDISEKSLNIAKQGIYYSRSLRMTDDEYKKKFFYHTSGTFEVKKSIKRLTSFISANIANPETWGDLHDIDIIFCRNVFIYFANEKMKRAVKNFHKILGKEGCLLLGHSETLTGISNDFEPMRYHRAIVYRKKER